MKLKKTLPKLSKYTTKNHVPKARVKKYAILFDASREIF